MFERILKKIDFKSLDNLFQVSPRNGEAQNSEDSKAAKIKLALEKMKEAKVISFGIFPKFHFFSRTSKNL